MSELAPEAPFMDLRVEEQEKVEEQADKQTAQAYFHPAWAKVEEMFWDEIASCDIKPDKKLPADEYKLKALADEQTKAALLTILERVKNAVTATEKAGTSQ
jgi:hypothetical protein